MQLRPVIVCSNDDPRFPLPLGRICSICFCIEKRIFFLETVAACDLKAGRCSQLNEQMKLQKYLRLRSDTRVLDYISVYTKYSGERLRTIGRLVYSFDLISALLFSGEPFFMTCSANKDLYEYLLRSGLFITGEKLLNSRTIFSPYTDVNNIEMQNMYDSREDR